MALIFWTTTLILSYKYVSCTLQNVSLSSTTTSANITCATGLEIIIFEVVTSVPECSNSSYLQLSSNCMRRAQCVVSANDVAGCRISTVVFDCVQDTQIVNICSPPPTLSPEIYLISDAFPAVYPKNLACSISFNPGRVSVFRILYLAMTQRNDGRTCYDRLNFFIDIGAAGPFLETEYCGPSVLDIVQNFPSEVFPWQNYTSVDFTFKVDAFTSPSEHGFVLRLSAVTGVTTTSAPTSSATTTTSTSLPVTKTTATVTTATTTTTSPTTTTTTTSQTTTTTKISPTTTTTTTSTTTLPHPSTPSTFASSSTLKTTPATSSSPTSSSTLKATTATSTFPSSQSTSKPASITTTTSPSSSKSTSLTTPAQTTHILSTISPTTSASSEKTASKLSTTSVSSTPSKSITSVTTAALSATAQKSTSSMTTHTASTATPTELSTKPLSPCTSSPCGSHGVCGAEPNENYTCHCDSKFTGQNCQTVSNLPQPSVCTVGLCRNNGTCYEGGRFTLCVCLNGFTGHICESFYSGEDSICFSVITVAISLLARFVAAVIM